MPPAPRYRKARTSLHTLCQVDDTHRRANTSSIHQHDTIQATREDASRARATLPEPGERQAAGAGWAAAALSSSRSVGARMKTSHMLSESARPRHPS